MEYYVSVKPCDKCKEDDSQSDNTDGCDFVSEASLNAIKTEYDYCFQRSQKIDTKVQIVVTICTVFFGGMLSFINTLPKPDLPTTYDRLYILIVFYIMIALQLILTFYIFYKTANLTKGVGVRRITQEDIISYRVFEYNRNDACEWLCKRYNNCIVFNIEVLDERYRKLNFILSILLLDFLIITACILMKVFLI